MGDQDGPNGSKLDINFLQDSYYGVIRVVQSLSVYANV